VAAWFTEKSKQSFDDTRLKVAGFVIRQIKSRLESVIKGMKRG